jgi:phosphatidate cytidylyltransferase
VPGLAPVSDLPKRVASALVLAVVALAATWYGGFPFSILWAAAAAAIFYEFAALRDRGAIPAWLAGVATALFLLAAATGAGLLDPGLTWSRSLIAVVAATAALATLLAVLAVGQSGPRWLATAFVYALVIAIVPPAMRAGPAGLATILWLFAVVWATDIFAYFGGRALGGPRLWPAISPKKTWSGFICGVLSGAVAGVAVAALTPAAMRPGGMSLPLLFVFSLLVAALSQGGDLMESRLKRLFGAKDSSALIPGHGGVMDRLDGFWAALVVVALARGFGAF